MLPDKTPCPGYATEWSVAYHADMMTGGALNISQERLQYLQKLKKVTIKYFANKYNILADQLQFTRAIHRYQMYLGGMEAGDYLCVNQDHHEKVKSFDSEPLMREHWFECHGIEVDEILVPMVVPDMLKEPGKNNLKVQGSSGTQSSTPGPSGPPVGAPGPEGDARPVTNLEPSKRTTHLDRSEVRRIAKAQSKLQFRGKSYKSKEALSDPNPDSKSSESPMDVESQGEPDRDLVKYQKGY